MGALLGCLLGGFLRVAGERREPGSDFGHQNHLACRVAGSSCMGRPHRLLACRCDGALRPARCLAHSCSGVLDRPGIDAICCFRFSVPAGGMLDARVAREGREACGDFGRGHNPVGREAVATCDIRGQRSRVLTNVPLIVCDMHA